MDEAVYFNAFNKIEGIGAKTIKKLKNHFGNLGNAWPASRNELILAGLGEKLVDVFLGEKLKINPKGEYAKLEKFGIKIITYADSAYPKLLLESADAPSILYQKGEFDLNSSPTLAMVGSRKFSEYGKQVAEKMAGELAQAGITVVSGLALGIDAISHRAALEKQGHTVAVLGGGLDDESIQPSYNFKLSKEIIESGQGCLLSEYPIFTTPQKFTFPARNRIMAGMSLGVLVVEAAEDSGSLITANCALENNREVFAIPGPIFSPTSLGTHNLIKKGAKLVSSVSDILEELDLASAPQKYFQEELAIDNPLEKTLMKILGFEPTSIDRLVKLSKLKTADVLATLALMEIKGWVRNIGSQNYIRSR